MASGVRPMRIEHALRRPRPSGSTRCCRARRRRRAWPRRTCGRASVIPSTCVRVGLVADDHVVLQVHGALRAGPSSPTSRARTRRRPWTCRPPRARDEALPTHASKAICVPARLAGHDHVLAGSAPAPRIGPASASSASEITATGARLSLEEVEIVVGPQHRVDRDRDRADLDGAPERGRGTPASRAAEQSTRCSGCTPRSRSALPVRLTSSGIRAVGQRGVLVEEGDLVAAPLRHVPIDEEGRRVEPGRDLHRHPPTCAGSRSVWQRVIARGLSRAARTRSRPAGR